ncbi:2-oxoacid dehydrogenases acyltransferase (catalytic domain) [Nakamurella panacisegetis]|uniref:2-oxoacid dehydrogenases acyltransferase (Catalytic domain) n=1 Tax=Nakamurella panacisegetis TaxID=1090615 RepID=A0A1H0K097_9ACTN|nr:2-oxo acid dehydrogenase subunit E2 [Nakamurella panacisegetis]SDO49294.1 2-oxoacid dehydrogenases acyltransferase (catalytic domain) [Nakamurella panacisegetis]
MTAVRPRRVRRQPFRASRRLVTAGLRAGRRLVPMYGLVEVDVTRARKALAENDPPLSMTAFVVASVARAAAEYPQVHAYRNWRGRLVIHSHVDVITLVEVPTAHGPIGRPHVLHDADIRSVADLTADLRRAQHEPGANRNRWMDRATPVVTLIPGALWVMYAVMARSVAVRQRIGTVAVTAVGMFAGGGGFGITPMTVASLEIVVGGMTQRPRAIDGQVEIRDVLDLTLTIDHRVVDGAPATRFGARFRELLETAAVIPD